jgi:RNA recognition motif-containing protein
MNNILTGYSNNAPSRGRGRGRGGFNPQLNRGGFQQDGNTADSGLEVQIRGWDGAGDRNDVIAFLLRKFGVQVQNPRFQGQFLYCTAPNPAAYQTLLNATGVRFAGKSLQVQSSQNRQQPGQQGGFQNQHTKSTYEILKGFLSTRYKADVGLLDLSNLASNETLQGSGFFQSATTQQKVPWPPFPTNTVISRSDESCVRQYTETGNRRSECKLSGQRSSRCPWR